MNIDSISGANAALGVTSTSENSATSVKEDSSKKQVLLKDESKYEDVDQIQDDFDISSNKVCLWSFKNPIKIQIALLKEQLITLETQILTKTIRLNKLEETIKETSNKTIKKTLKDIKESLEEEIKELCKKRDAIKSKIEKLKAKLDDDDDDDDYGIKYPSTSYIKEDEPNLLTSK